MMGKIFKAAALGALLLLTTHYAGTAAPNAPTDLTVSVNVDDNGTYSATFHWHAPRGANTFDGRVDGYRLYARDLMQDGSEFEEVGTTNETSITLGDRLNVCCTAYTFYVKSYVTSDDGITYVESDESNRVSTVCGRDYNDGDFDDVLANGANEFVSNPPERAKLGSEYRYDAAVMNDIHGHTADISFSLANGPEGMTINEKTGLVTWTPSEPGIYNVQIDATLNDTKQVQEQLWTVDVQSSAAGVPMVAGATSSVYPNPATAQLTVELGSAASTSDLRVSDLTGRPVLFTSVPAGIASYGLDVSALASGRYFLHIRNAASERVVPFNVVR